MWHFDTKKMNLHNSKTVIEKGDDFLYHHTCVPRQLFINLQNLELNSAYEWREHPIALNNLQVNEEGDLFSTLAEEYKKGYDRSEVISAIGEIEHRITVFDTEGQNIDLGYNAKISFALTPQPNDPKYWQVGGKFNANASDGIDFSGHRAKVVPDEGLMVGEPGSILYFKSEYKTSANEPDLHLELVMPEDEFHALANEIKSTSQPISSAQAFVVAELFQYEIDSAIGYEMPSKDYALLIDGRHSARLERFTISFGQGSNETAETLEESPFKKESRSGWMRLFVTLNLIWLLILLGFYNPSTITDLFSNSLTYFTDKTNLNLIILKASWRKFLELFELFAIGAALIFSIFSLGSWIKEGFGKK